MLRKSFSVVVPLGHDVTSENGEAKSLREGTALNLRAKYLDGLEWDDPEKWNDLTNFKTEEFRRREAAEKERGAENLELFMSHCWRHEDEEHQRRKRRIISYISGPAGKGRTYWADYLDLQAKGPVPWRKEIFEGIDKASKVVLFIDRAYLVSFNCLQEMAYALELGKPLVVVLLDEESKEMLTSPKGADHAWDTVNADGDVLSAREGQELLGAGLRNRDGEPALALTKEELRRMFKDTSDINFCWCRANDFEDKSAKVVLSEVLHSMTTDLAYHKEHAALTSEASKWLNNGETDDRLLRGDDLDRKERWLEEVRNFLCWPLPSQWVHTPLGLRALLVGQRKDLFSACLLYPDAEQYAQPTDMG